MKDHTYKISLEWTGNEGKGTSSYRAYNRSFIIEVKGKKMQIEGSSDPAFLGDPTRYNPEEMLISSISSCHMLWYLHLCSTHGIIVNEYVDEARGVMHEFQDGSGKFGEVTLYPKIRISDSKNLNQAYLLHHEAHKMCFIANSCNFPIYHEPDITFELKTIV